MSLLTCGFNTLSSDHDDGEHTHGPDDGHSSSSPSASPTSSRSNSGLVGESLRLAMQNAQTRARQQEERVALVEKRVEQCMKAAIRKVQKAKKEVAALGGDVHIRRRKRKGSNETSTGGAWQQDAHRSASDSNTALSSSAMPSIGRLGGMVTSASLSPHSGSFLSAMSSQAATPHCPAIIGVGSAPTSSFMLTSRLPPPAQPAHGTGMLNNMSMSPSMPSLLNPPAATPILSNATLSNVASPQLQSSQPASPLGDKKDEAIIDGSYCLLPYQSDGEQGTSLFAALSSTSSSSSAMPSLPHSSSHAAMLAAQEAMAELQRDACSAPTSPEAAYGPSATTPSSLPALHTESPVSSESGGITHPYPSVSSMHAHHPPLVPSPSSAPSSSGQTYRILAASPYAITPSASLPPVRRHSVRPPIGPSRTVSGSTVSPSNILSPNLQPFSPSLPPHALSASITSAAASHALSQLYGGGMSVASSYAMIGHAAASSAPVSSPALTAALNRLREAQIRFSTLAKFCAPLLMHSHAFHKMKEDEELRRLRALAEEEQKGNETDPAASSSSEVFTGPGLASSDDELTASAVDAIATQAVNEGNDRVDEHLRSDSETNSSSQIRSPPPQQARSMAASSSLVMVDSQSLAASSSSRHPVTASQAATEQAVQQRRAMRAYIRKLRAEVMLDDEEALKREPDEHIEQEEAQLSSVSSSAATSSSSRPTPASSSDIDADVTLDEAMEGCVLLHHHLLAARSELEELRSSAEKKIADAIAICSTKVQELADKNEALERQLMQSEKARNAEITSLRASLDASQRKNANMEALLLKLNIKVDEDGNAQGEQQKSSSWWRWASAALVVSSVAAVVSLSWKRVLLSAHSRYPSLVRGLGISDAFVSKIAQSCAEKAKERAAQAAAEAARKAATQKATEATMNAAAKAAAASAAFAAASSQAAASHPSQSASTTWSSTSNFSHASPPPFTSSVSPFSPRSSYTQYEFVHPDHRHFFGHTDHPSHPSNHWWPMRLVDTLTRWGMERAGFTGI